MKIIVFRDRCECPPVHLASCLCSLTSAVKPLVELLSSEAIIDIKPELDDDLIAEDLAEGGTGGSRTMPAGHSSARPSAELYRPPPAVRAPGAPARTPGRAQESLHGYRPTEPYSRPHHTSVQDSRGSRPAREVSPPVHLQLHQRPSEGQIQGALEYFKFRPPRFIGGFCIIPCLCSF